MGLFSKLRGGDKDVEKKNPEQQAASSSGQQQPQRALPPGSAQQSSSSGSGPKALPGSTVTGVARQQPQSTAVGRLSESQEDRMARYRQAGQQAKEEQTSAQKEGKVVILIDATGSQQPTINGVRNQMDDIVMRAREQAGERLQVEVIAYRDYGDSKIIERSGFRNDPGQIKQWLRGIYAAGGGERGEDPYPYPEALEYGLNEVVQMQDVVDMVLIIGDARAHSAEELVYYRKRGYPVPNGVATDVAKTLRDSKVIIHTFHVPHPEDSECKEGSPLALENFKAIAKAGGGQCGILDGSEAVRDMAVMAILAALKGGGVAGKKVVQDYMAKYAGQLSSGSQDFGNKLLTDGKK